jgi:hypothetical protein
MNSFWGNLLEHFKTKSAWLFMPALLIFIALVLFSQGLASLCANVDFSSIDYEKIIRLLFWVMPAIVLLLVAGIGGIIRRSHIRRLKHYETLPLSRDEIRKARSKLVNRIKT